MPDSNRVSLVYKSSHSTNCATVIPLMGEINTKIDTRTHRGWYKEAEYIRARINILQAKDNEERSKTLGNGYGSVG